MKVKPWIIGLVLAVCWLSGCDKKEELSPCQQLVAREVECSFQNRASLTAEAKQALVTNCEGKMAEAGMRMALECGRVAHECTQFLSCRNQATELPGGK